MRVYISLLFSMPTKGKDNVSTSQVMFITLLPRELLGLHAKSIFFSLLNELLDIFNFNHFGEGAVVDGLGLIFVSADVGDILGVGPL